eukprot:5228949-Prymnesium_polylepis.1
MGEQGGKKAWRARWAALAWSSGAARVGLKGDSRARSAQGWLGLESAALGARLSLRLQGCSAA